MLCSFFRKKRFFSAEPPHALRLSGECRPKTSSPQSPLARLRRADNKMKLAKNKGFFGEFLRRRRVRKGGAESFPADSRGDELKGTARIYKHLVPTGPRDSNSCRSPLGQLRNPGSSAITHAGLELEPQAKYRSMQGHLKSKVIRALVDIQIAEATNQGDFLCNHHAYATE